MLVAFAVTLVLTVLLSKVAMKTALSTAVFVLGAGVLVGPAVLGLVHGDRGQEGIRTLAESALVAVLFVEGLELDLGELRENWSAPLRALGVAMPITIGIVVLLARALLSLSWAEAFVVAAALAPTDPVFAAALTNEPDVPARARDLLRVESGLNDGLALPAVLVGIAAAGGHETGPVAIAREIGLGVVLGVAVPAAYSLLERTPLLGVSETYAPIRAVALALVIFGLSNATGANVFLAMFAGGTTLGVLTPGAAKAARPFGAAVTETLKLAATFVFGVILPAEVVTRTDAGTWLFAAGCLVVARPLAIGLSLVKSRLDRSEIAVSAWFGPRGFASIVFAVMVAHSAIPGARKLFDVIALTTALSIVVHSSTDTIVAHRFRRRAAQAA